MKYILIIGDGMADEPVPDLNNKTPLEYAKTPCMDKLAATGEIGEALTVPVGMQAGSDVAILSIFGYNPAKLLSGRAPLEAAAVGINLKPGDIAYRCNMVSFEDVSMSFFDKKILSHSAGAIEGDISDALITELMNNPEFNLTLNEVGMIIYPGGSFRHIAVCKKLDERTVPLSTFPPHDHIGEKLGLYLPKGGENAGILINLMQKAHEILDQHPINIKRRGEGKLPANGIWFWAEGIATALPSFYEKYKKTGAVISAVPLCQGIGVLVGLTKISVEGATGELITNYEGKVEAAVRALEACDFVVVHIEAPDECTHNGDLNGKIQAIEWIDSRIIAPLTTKLKEKNIDFRMLIISDHKTLISTRGHDGSPVPYILYESRVNLNTGINTGVTFSERSAANQRVKKLGNSIPAGDSLMGMLFNENDS